MGIALNFCLDVGHKQSRFFGILLKKSFKFVLSRKDSTIIFKLSLVLLPVKVDFITKKRGCKEETFRTRGTSCVKIIFVLLTEVVALYIQGPIV